MPAPGSRRFSFRYPEALKRRLDVAAAMASEALVTAHTAHAHELVELLDGRVPFDEAAIRYVREMDLPPSLAASVQTRVLAALEARGAEEPVPVDEPADARSPSSSARWHGWPRSACLARTTRESRRSAPGAAAATPPDPTSDPQKRPGG